MRIKHWPCALAIGVILQIAGMSWGDSPGNAIHLSP